MFDFDKCCLDVWWTSAGDDLWYFTVTCWAGIHTRHWLIIIIWNYCWNRIAIVTTFYKIPSAALGDPFPHRSIIHNLLLKVTQYSNSDKILRSLGGGGRDNLLMKLNFRYYGDVVNVLKQSFQVYKMLDWFRDFCLQSLQPLKYHFNNS